jgi:two-component system, response regulator
MNLPVVLVVDDDPDDADLLRMAFRRHEGHAVLVVADDGEAALDYLHEASDRPEAPRHAVVLLDLKLRRVGGLDVLRRIRQSPAISHLPVVLMTSSAEGRDIADGYRAGANGYVRKPDSFEELEQAISAVVGFWVSLNEVPDHRARKDRR